VSFLFKYFSKHCTAKQSANVLCRGNASPPSLALQIAGSKIFGAVEPEGKTRLEHDWNTIGTLEITRWDSHKMYDKL
jgi:hypothetical protein